MANKRKPPSKTLKRGRRSLTRRMYLSRQNTVAAILKELIDSISRFENSGSMIQLGTRSTTPEPDKNSPVLPAAGAFSIEVVEEPPQLAVNLTTTFLQLESQAGPSHKEEDALSSHSNTPLVPLDCALLDSDEYDR